MNELKSLTLNGKKYDSFPDQTARENGGGGSTEGAVLYKEQTLTDEQKAQARKNIGALDESAENRISKLELLLGTSAYGVGGTAIATPPAYSYIRIADGITLEKGKSYTIRAKAETDSTDYSAYVSVMKEAGGSIKLAQVTHQSPNGEATVSFVADADYENAWLALRSNLTSGLTVTATLEGAESANLKEQVEHLSENIAGSRSLFNPFATAPVYHHLNQETTSTCNIPAQSIYDVNYAKALGFSLIEVNTHKCSDGVFVCKHGSSGKLGYGLKADDGQDYSETLFKDVTSDWLRSHITYNAIDKYSGHIPTLEEVCAECKKLSMMIKISNAEAVAVARKYLPDDMIWSTQNKRGDFRGLIEYVWYKSQTIDSCIATCLNIGSPINIVIAAGEFGSHTDDEIKELTQKAHENGFTVGTVYPTSSDIIRALSLGVDAICSTANHINLFDAGDVMNIRNLNDSKSVYSDGASYDADNDVISMAELSTIGVTAENIPSGKLSLRLRYSGSVTINDDLTYESDGSVTIPYAVVMQPKRGKTYDKWLTIKADSQTTIYEISLSCATV